MKTSNRKVVLELRPDIVVALERLGHLNNILLCENVAACSFDVMGELRKVQAKLAFFLAVNAGQSDQIWELDSAPVNKKDRQQRAAAAFKKQMNSLRGAV